MTVWSSGVSAAALLGRATAAPSALADGLPQADLLTKVQPLYWGAAQPAPQTPRLAPAVRLLSQAARWEEKEAANSARW